MSAVPFTATTCCHERHRDEETERGKPARWGAEEPAGEVERQPERETEKDEVQAKEQVVGAVAVGRRRGRGEEGSPRRVGQKRAAPRRSRSGRAGPGTPRDRGSPGRSGRPALAQVGHRLGVVDVGRKPPALGELPGHVGLHERRLARGAVELPPRNDQRDRQGRRRRAPPGGSTAPRRPPQASGSAPASCAGGRSSVDHVQLGPLGQLAVESAAADAHQLRSLRPVAPGLDERLPEDALLVLLDRERLRGRRRRLRRAAGGRRAAEPRVQVELASPCRPCGGRPRSRRSFAARGCSPARNRPGAFSSRRARARAAGRRSPPRTS